MSLRTVAAAVVPGRGLTTLGAGLSFVAPLSTAGGSYASTVTVTLVGS